MKIIFNKDILKETCITMIKLTAFLSIGIFIPAVLQYLISLYVGVKISIIILITYEVMLIFAVVYYCEFKYKKETEKHNS